MSNRQYENTAIKPCPFCGAEIVHVESWAKSFNPPRLFHEYHHPENACYLSHHRHYFGDDREVFLFWVDRWNQRVS